MRKRLTVEGVEKLKPPKRGASGGDERTLIYDAVVAGLVLRVSPSGRKAWSLVYRPRGGGPRKQRRLSLGRYPAVDLPTARKKANDALTALDEGRDPADERDASRRDTFEKVFERWIKADQKGPDEENPLKRRWREVEASVRNYAVSKWGDRPISSITRADVHELLDEVVAAGKIGAARALLIFLGRLFSWAEDREIITKNPARKLLGQRHELKPRKRERVLSDAELRAVWNAAPKLGELRGAAVRLLLLTGQRKREISEAEWSEIDAKEKTLHIPAVRRKNGAHTVPLSTAAWGIIESLPEEDDTGLLFPSDDGESAWWLGNKVLKDLRAAAPDPGNKSAFTLHDFRRTAETRLAALGFRQEVIDRVLGHVTQGMASTYNRHTYLEEKREALEAYARHVLEVVNRRG